MSILELYQLEDFWEGSFLLRYPYVIPAITLFYVIFVLHLGPKWMKNREPFKIEKVLIVYNLVQMIWCFKLAYDYTPLVIQIDYTCNSIPGKDVAIALLSGGKSYFIMKLVDLLDTVFFVMRKKFKQITHLHVYHHAAMVIICYYALYHFPTMYAGFIVYLNVIVHLFMYSYYLISAYAKTSTMWWKKHITQLQMLQFALNIIVYTQLFFRKNCQLPSTLSPFIVIQNIYMMFLFGKFYYKTYIKRKVV